MNLGRRIKKKLDANGVKGITIPQLSNELPDVKNRFEIMYEVAKLESSGEAVLMGFDEVYREDGGAIYLARYKSTKY